MKSPIYFWSRTIFVILTLVVWYLCGFFYLLYFLIVSLFGIGSFSGIGFGFFIVLILCGAGLLIKGFYIQSQSEISMTKEKDYNLPILNKILAIGIVMITFAILFYVIGYTGLAFLVLSMICSAPGCDNSALGNAIFWWVGYWTFLWLMILFFQIVKYFKKPKNISTESQNP